MEQTNLLSISESFWNVIRSIKQQNALNIRVYIIYPLKFSRHFISKSFYIKLTKPTSTPQPQESFSLCILSHESLSSSAY